MEPNYRNEKYNAVREDGELLSLIGYDGIIRRNGHPQYLIHGQTIRFAEDPDRVIGEIRDGKGILLADNRVMFRLELAQ